MSKGRQNLVLLLLTACSCMVVEGVSRHVLERRGDARPFMFRWERSAEIDGAQRIGFDRAHPLWGWNMSGDSLRSLGYETQGDLIVLTNTVDPQHALRIYVTGGSTSDLALDPCNWPDALHRMLTDSGIGHTIYAAGVGGFNSSQEYLRLIQEGLLLQPHVHISYSGANEEGDFGYVTEYENDLYHRLISAYSESLFMPNAVALLRQIFGFNRGLTIPPLDALDTFLHFRQNLLLMQAAAGAFGHTHIGVLQPLRGLGANDPVSSYKRHRHWMKVYQAYYPEMQGFVAQHEGTLYDFTDLFDGVTSSVYVDDCHILPEHQPLIAQRLFNILDRTDAIRGLMIRSRSVATKWR